MIAFPVNNNSLGSHPVPCSTIRDATGRTIGSVYHGNYRKYFEAVDLAFEICQALNAHAEMVRRCEECRAHIPPHRRDVEIVDFIQYGREVKR